MQGESFPNVSVKALREKFERLAQAANSPLNGSRAAQPNVPNPALRHVPPAAVPAANVASDLRRLAPNRPALVAGVINMPRLMNGNGGNAQNPPFVGVGNRPLPPPAGIANQPLQPPAAVANRPPAGIANRPPAAAGNQPPR